MSVFARHPFATWLTAAIIGTFCLKTSPARAEDHDFQSWTQLYFDAKFDGNWHASLDIQVRRGDTPFVQTMDGTVQDTANTQVLLRPAVGYAFANWLTGWVGYLFNPVLYDNAANRSWTEHRLWQQVIPSWTWDWMKLALRSRFEERFRTDGAGSGEVAVRFRQLVKASFPLDDTWSIIASDELWFHLNSTAFRTEPGIDQNRAFLGVGVKATPTLSLEFGYLQQFVHRFTDPDQFNHAFALTVSVPLDFTTASPPPSL